jgi:hypothetical protein
MDDHWKWILGGIAGVLVIGAAASASGKTKRKPFKALYYPGESIDAWMSQTFTVRLPRGDYQVVADNVEKDVELDIGNSTDVVLLAKPAHAPYAETVRFIDLGSGKEYKVQVSVQPLPAPGSKK